MDTRPIAEHSTVPYHAQVVAFDPTVADAVPTWADDSLDRGIAAGQSGIAIATRSDYESGSDDLASVRMRVWIGAAQTPAGSVIYEGALRIGGDGLMVGSVVGNDLRHVTVRAGDYRVKVYVEPREAPDLVDVVLNPDAP